MTSAIRKAIIGRKSTTEIRKLNSDHISALMMERMNYRIKQDNASLHPAQFCCIILDWADIFSFGLPHSLTSTRNVRHRALKARLIGVLEHLKPNKLPLFMMIVEHKRGANHIVETIHRFIADHVTSGPLPSALFIQLDSCARGDKNHYSFSYIEALTSWNVFRTIGVSVLPVGLTHEDV